MNLLKKIFITGAVLTFLNIPNYCNEEESKEFSLEDYSLILNRDIFDPNRGTYVTPPPPVLSPKPKSVDFVGVVLTPYDSVVFLEGSMFKTPIEISKGDKITSYTLTQADLNNAVFENGRTEIDLPIGKTLFIYPNGEWEVDN